jgi:hypothetical protein
MKISLSNLKERLKELLAGVDLSNQSTVIATISEFLQFSFENYDSLDDEAKGYVDRAFETLRRNAQVAVDALPEGVEKRQALRHIGLAEGAHFRAGDLLGVLESPTQIQHSIVPAARETFVQLLQHILDVLFDVSQHSHKGVAKFAKIGLFFWIVDELLVAFHLSQRAFTNQSYTHVRTVLEILDKIELFDKQPEWAELWVKGEEKDLLRELSPSAVRKKLGEPKHDPIYSFFSQLGPHGTFVGLQARGYRYRQPPDESAKHFRIWVGGSPMVHHIVWTNSYCVHMALATLMKSIKVFEDSLNTGEMTRVMDSATELVVRFYKEQYVVWAKEAGLDTGPIVELLEKEPWKKRTSSD